MKDIGPKFDTKDYYGNLPIHYTIMKDDIDMVKKYFTKPEEYIDKKNFRNETIFHIAAKHNSVESLKAFVQNKVWIDSLLQRNFMGDTPIHVAAKSGNVQILSFFLKNSTAQF